MNTLHWNKTDIKSSETTNGDYSSLCTCLLIGDNQNNVYMVNSIRTVYICVYSVYIKNEITMMQINRRVLQYNSTSSKNLFNKKNSGITNRLFKLFTTSPIICTHISCFGHCGKLAQWQSVGIEQETTRVQIPASLGALGKSK